MKFNEDSRVKIPCLLHLVSLGYEYLSLKNATWDEDTNIFPDLFKEAIAAINPEVEPSDINRRFEDIKLTLDNEDLGKAFYDKLLDQSGIKLIDFSHFKNNHFHVVTELTYKNGEEEFSDNLSSSSSLIVIIFKLFNFLEFGRFLLLLIFLLDIFTKCLLFWLLIFFNIDFVIL